MIRLATRFNFGLCQSVAILFNFHAEFINGFRWSDGIIAVEASQTETIFFQSGGSDHAVY